MPTTQTSTERVKSHRVSILPTWVATSGCWTAETVLLPHNAAAVWGAVVLGVLLAYVTAQASRRVARSAERRPALAGIVPNVPTLFGLVAAACTAVASYHSASVGAAIGATVANTFTEMSQIKVVITVGLIVCYVVEQGWRPLTGAMRRALVTVIKEALDHGSEPIPPAAEKEKKRV